MSFAVLSSMSLLSTVVVSSSVTVASSWACSSTGFDGLVEIVILVDEIGDKIAIAVIVDDVTHTDDVVKVVVDTDFLCFLLTDSDEDLGRSVSGIEGGDDAGSEE